MQNSKFKIQKNSTAVRCRFFVLLHFAFCILLSPSLRAAPETLTDPERDTVAFWLSIINGVLLLLVVGMVLVAAAVRVIARRTTHPCPNCMEFIPKKESVCSRCGKTVDIENAKP